MPLVNYEKYVEMLETAKNQHYAYPAINITSSDTVTAAIQGFAEAESDGIIEISSGGATFASGKIPNDPVTGSLAIAAYVHEVAKKYPINIALHTDHCPMKWVEGWLKPLLRYEIEQVKRGEPPAFNSHMWDGSMIDLDENLRIAQEVLAMSVQAKTILEVEIGAVGGEEDDVKASDNEKLYTTTEDALKAVDALGAGEKGVYMTALTFGSVHGVIKPGTVKLRPDLLSKINREVGEKIGKPNPFYLVFHGSSGSSDDEIREAVSHGIVKMNVDTDCQYAYTRPVVDWMTEHHDAIIGVNDLPDKKLFDPRKWVVKAQQSMADHVGKVCQLLGSAGRTLG
jgi:fructose-bisphosphate aldolase class II